MPAFGGLTAGRRVAAIEAEFAEKVGARYAVSSIDATSVALVLTKVVGVTAGSEVIVPTWTFSSPAMMAHKLGARVVLADVEEATSNLSARTAAPLLSDRTAVVMPTHFAGLRCDMDGLAELCATAGIHLLDDAALANFPVAVVSPLHALLLDGVLMPAWLLINGRGAVQEEHASKVRYFHIELGRHAALLTDGAAAEAFAEDNNRAMFDNAADAPRQTRLQQPTDVMSFAPRVTDGNAF